MESVDVDRLLPDASAGLPCCGISVLLNVLLKLMTVHVNNVLNVLQ